MQATIDVNSIAYTTKGHKKLVTSEGTFYINSKDFKKVPIETTGSYSVVYNVSEFKGNTMNWINSMQGAQSPPPTPTNGHSSHKDEAIRENMVLKADSIKEASVLKAKSVCLEAAVAMTTAWSTTLSRGENDIVTSQGIQQYKDEQYQDNLEKLGLAEPTIPF